MADNKLEIQVGVNVDDLTKGIAKSQKELDRLRNEQKKLDKEYKNGIRTEKEYYQQSTKNRAEIKRLTQSINKETNALIKLDNVQDQVGKGMKKVGKTTSANATPALQEFSRVIQDAPYGIQGVGNNITQLVSQFGYLSKATGGGSAALKAMLSSLAGPGGVLFAISTLVSLLTVYGDEIKGFISGTKDAKAEQDKLTESIDKQIEALNGLSRARYNAGQASADDLVKTRLLFKAATDLTKPIEDRKKD